MKAKLMALMLVAGGSLLAGTHVSIGVHVGTPGYGYVAPYAPPCPGPGYVWIDGYRDPYGRWYKGYWAMPPYAGAYWVAPRYMGQHWHPGHWYGPRRDRDHHWRDRNRHDRGRYDRDRHRGRDFGRGFRRR